MAAIMTRDDLVALNSRYIERLEVDCENWNIAEPTWQVLAYVQHKRATAGEVSYVIARGLTEADAKRRLESLSQLL